MFGICLFSVHELTRTQDQDNKVQPGVSCIWNMSPAVACVKSSRGVYLLVIDLNF